MVTYQRFKTAKKSVSSAVITIIILPFRVELESVGLKQDKINDISLQQTFDSSNSAWLNVICISQSTKGCRLTSGHPGISIIASSPFLLKLYTIVLFVPINTPWPYSLFHTLLHCQFVQFVLLIRVQIYSY